jgi:hypothetical protein
LNDGGHGLPNPTTQSTGKLLLQHSNDQKRSETSSSSSVFAIFPQVNASIAEHHATTIAAPAAGPTMRQTTMSSSVDMASNGNLTSFSKSKQQPPSYLHTHVQAFAAYSMTAFALTSTPYHLPMRLTTPDTYQA